MLKMSNGWVLTRIFFSRESRRKGRRSLALGLHCTFPGEPAQTALLPLLPSKMKITAEVHFCGGEMGTCPPAWNKKRLGSDSKFFFEGISEEGLSLPCSGAALHLPWRACMDSPSPLPLLKMKVAAEVYYSGDEVGTCPHAQNEQRLGSDSKFFFEGKLEEGPLLPCSGAALHLPWRACVDSPSPPPSLENESHGGGTLLWGRGGDMSPCLEQAMVGF